MYELTSHWLVFNRVTSPSWFAALLESPLKGHCFSRTDDKIELTRVYTRSVWGAHLGLLVQSSSEGWIEGWLAGDKAWRHGRKSH